MPSWGVTQAGFVAKPLSAILADMQAQVLTTISPAYDLSPQTPDGQFLGIVAAAAASNWELLQLVYNQFNRQDVEGAGLDNLGDVVGIPRASATFTQVGCTLVFGSTAVAGVYAPGSFIANVAGNSALTFSNLNSIQLAGGAQTLTGVLFQATTIGPTPTINPGTLTVITTPVTGWTSITNPATQQQMGTNSELDSVYGPRQAANVAAEGSCSAAATVAALIALGAAQTPPQTLNVTCLENTGNATATISGVSMPPHTYAPVIYDGGTGWAAANPSLIANTIYLEKPAGITSTGTTFGTVTDPILGPQTESWILPSSVPLYISATVVPRVGQNFAQLVTAIQNALVLAAIAPTPASGVPPIGQLAPGQPVIGSQLEAIIMGVPGVLDVQVLTFGTAPSPSNTAPITVAASQVATILQATVATNVVITQGTAP